MERIELARCLGFDGRGGAIHHTVIEERLPERFMQAFRCAVAVGGTVFVADPSWGAVERARLAEVVGQSPATRGQRSIDNLRSEVEDRESETGQGWLCLPTGGSSGVVRWARHDQDTLAAAVRGFCGHFEVGQVNAVGVLPLHHVSGLMAWMRCAFTGGRYIPWAWADMEAGRWPQPGAGDWFLSLVPTQLQRLLGRPEAVDRLRRFRAVFIGGGPAWPDLLDRAADAGLPLAPGYGMTETAAMVAALKPREFLLGRRGCGSALPHAVLTLNQDGVIQIAAGSLFHGYFPGWREEPGPWSTEDLGRVDEKGELQVIGRRDAVIISGGKKIEPAEVEAVLRSTGQFVDVAVLGVPDAEWGESVVAAYPDDTNAPDLALVERFLAGGIASYKRPKHYVAVGWPRNAQGKINRKALKVLVAAKIGGPGGRQGV
jgi:O-succinylbenzoic acid--CoA ligase